MNTEITHLCELILTLTFSFLKITKQQLGLKKVTGKTDQYLNGVKPDNGADVKIFVSC